MTKKQDRDEVFKAIYNMAQDIMWEADQALGRKTAKAQEKYINEIMEMTEEIERLYSSNWH